MNKNNKDMEWTFEDYLIEIGIRSLEYGYETKQLYENKAYFKKCYDTELSAYKALLFLHDYLQDDYVFDEPVLPIPVVSGSAFLLILQSSFYTDEQNQFSYDNMIKVNWSYGVPNEGDTIHLEDIIEMPDFDKGNLSWQIESVDYRKIDGIIRAVVWMDGI